MLVSYLYEVYWIDVHVFQKPHYFQEPGAWRQADKNDYFQIWRLVCQMLVFRAGTSNYTPQILGDVIICLTDTGGRLNKKDGLTRYGDSHVKDKTS